MASEVISNLRINVTADTKEANKSIESTKKSVSGMTPYLKQLKTNFQNTFGGLTNILSSFKKMALRLALRTLIKNMFSGLGDGFKAYIAYSSEAKSAMDEFTTSAHYLSNSIASALMPVLIQLVPIFTKIVDAIVGVINRFSEMVAWIQGKNTYTAAKRVAYEYGEEADKANKKTKELKRTIMGFDEINALSKQSDSSSSSSATSATKDIYEELAVDSEAAEQFLNWIKLIGAAFALWKISELLSGLGKLSTVMSSLAALGIVVIGVTLTYTGFKEYFKSGDKTSLLMGIGGVLATVLGSTYLGFKIGGPWGAVVGLAIGATISIATVLFAAKDAALEKDSMWQLQQDIKEKIEKYAEVNATIKVNLDTYVGNADTIFGNYSEAKKTVDDIYDVLEKGNLSAQDIDTLNQKLAILNGMGLTEITEAIGDFQSGVFSSREEVQGLLKDLELLALKEAASSNLSGALADKVSAGQNINDIQSKLSIANNGLTKEKLKEYSSYMLIHNKADADAISKKLGYDSYASLAKSGNMQDVTKVLSEFASTIGLSNLIQSNSAKITGQQLANIYDLETELENAQSLYNNASEQVELWTGITTGSLDDTMTAMLNTEASAEKAMELFVDNTGVTITDSLGNTYTDTIHTADQIVEYINNLSPELNVTVKYKDRIDTSTLEGVGGVGVGNTLASMLGTTQAVINTISQYKSRGGDNSKTKIAQLVSSVNGTNLSKTQLSQITKNWDKFANGGFPEDGLFYANHNELVGTFSNGKTAVANNDQIIEGIKQGVAEGMSMSNNGQGGDWTIQIVDDYGNIRGETIVSAIERYNRQAGKSVIQVN